MPSTSSPSFVSRTISGTQPSIRSLVKIKEKKEASKIVGRCCLWSDIPFNIVKNILFYQSMFDDDVVVGLRHKTPTYDELSVNLS
jgi:hypothetical protein